MKLTPEQQTWLSDQMEKTPVEPNPCVRLHGKGPEGITCKKCALLLVHDCSKRYYKCALRKNTHGPATDHKVGWNACSKFKPEAT